MKARHALALGETLQGLHGLTDTPIVKMALRYWWLSVPVSLALYGKIQERREKGKVRLYHVFSDVGSILGPVATFIALAEVAHRLDRTGKLAPPVANVQDAEYTVQAPEESV